MSELRFESGKFKLGGSKASWEMERNFFGS